MAGEGAWVASFFDKGAWQSPLFANQANPSLVEKVVGNRWTTLDKHVRLGLTLSVPFFPFARQQPAPDAVSMLVQAAVEDDDEWVRLMGRAVGTGRLDFDAVMAEDSKVRDGFSGKRPSRHKICRFEACRDTRRC